jgi:hypothetical protein
MSDAIKCDLCGRFSERPANCFKELHCRQVTGFDEVSYRGVLIIAQKELHCRDEVSYRIDYCARCAEELGLLEGQLYGSRTLKVAIVQLIKELVQFRATNKQRIQEEIQRRSERIPSFRLDTLDGSYISSDCFLPCKD